MELSEAIKIIRDSFLFKDANEYIQLKEAISTVLRELESARKFIEEEEDAITERNNKICELEYKNIELQKENELARKTLIENSNIADERNDLLVEVQKLKKENEEYSKQLDLEYVDKNFVSKDKIKEKIEELDKNELLGKYNYEQVKIAIDILKELLIDKEPKKYSTYEIQRNIMPELLKGE